MANVRGASAARKPSAMVSLESCDCSVPLVMEGAVGVVGALRLAGKGYREHRDARPFGPEARSAPQQSAATDTEQRRRQGSVGDIFKQLFRRGGLARR